MDKIIIRLYEFLLHDSPNFIEGEDSSGYPVYGTASVMEKRFSEVFGKKPLPFKKSFGDPTTIWHIDDCTIDYSVKRDRETPGNPLCFGYLAVAGKPENVNSINSRLVNSFPRIDALVKEKNYE
jgi:hypothetical protein